LFVTISQVIGCEDRRVGWGVKPCSNTNSSHCTSIHCQGCGVRRWSMRVETGCAVETWKYWKGSTGTTDSISTDWRPMNYEPSSRAWT